MSFLYLRVNTITWFYLQRVKDAKLVCLSSPPFTTRHVERWQRWEVTGMRWKWHYLGGRMSFFLYLFLLVCVWWWWAGGEGCCHVWKEHFVFQSLHAQLDSQMGLMLCSMQSDGVSGTRLRCEFTSVWSSDTELRGIRGLELGIPGKL